MDPLPDTPVVDSAPADPVPASQTEAAAHEQALALKATSPARLLAGSFEILEHALGDLQSAEDATVSQGQKVEEARRRLNAVEDQRKGLVENEAAIRATIGDAIKGCRSTLDALEQDLAAKPTS